jgi:hypothetical protein
VVFSLRDFSQSPESLPQRPKRQPLASGLGSRQGVGGGLGVTLSTFDFRLSTFDFRLSTLLCFELAVMFCGPQSCLGTVVKF